MASNKTSSLKIMMRLLSFLKPLIFAMVFAICFGVLGHLSASMIPYLSVKTIVQGNFQKSVMILILMLGIFRGVFRYVEQLLNHHIAFRILAEIRHHVFEKLSELSPSKLEDRKQGDLMSMITSDIELIEVFYAHTISPIFIFIFYMMIILYILVSYSTKAAIFTLIAHILVVYVIPKTSNHRSKETGLKARKQNGQLSSNVLSTIYGLFSISQFSMQKKQKSSLEEDNQYLGYYQAELRKNYAFNFMTVDVVIYLVALLMMLTHKHLPIGDQAILLVLYLNSFGPSISLANLGFDLQETLASAQRILNLLEENPKVKQSQDPQPIGRFEKMDFDDVFFQYDKTPIIRGVSFELKRGEILGIQGKSGCGKSTLLKLMMRFWDVSSGQICINEIPIDKLCINELYEKQALMSQEPILFEDTIAYNISFNDPRYRREDIREAAKKAEIDDLISGLKHGYDTKLAELGDSLSAGEKQRIALARLFLFDRDVWLLDEPTSNLDSYNEALILQSILKHRKDRSIVLVSHRESTLRICDRVLKVESGTVKETSLS